MAPDRFAHREKQGRAVDRLRQDVGDLGHLAGQHPLQAVGVADDHELQRGAARRAPPQLRERRAVLQRIEGAGIEQGYLDRGVRPEALERPPARVEVGKGVRAVAGLQQRAREEIERGRVAVDHEHGRRVGDRLRGGGAVVWHAP